MRKKEVEIVEEVPVPVGDTAGGEDEDFLAELGVGRVGGWSGSGGGFGEGFVNCCHGY